MVVVASVVVVPVGRVDRGVIVMSTSRRGNSVVGGSNPCSDVGNDAVVLLAVVVVVVTDDVANGFSIMLIRWFRLICRIALWSRLA